MIPISAAEFAARPVVMACRGRLRLRAGKTNDAGVWEVVMGDTPSIRGCLACSDGTSKSFGIERLLPAIFQAKKERKYT